MFIIFATKPLNDRTKGFRFNFIGVKGIVRKRKTLSRGYSIALQKSMTALHMGKLTVYFERKQNRYSKRMIRHFAG